MAQQLVCWNCGASLADIPRPISRHADCPKCHEVLHCCRMCRWYSPGRPVNCDHDRAEPPVEKEIANFCEFFSPTFGSFVASEAERKGAARSKFDALFGDGESEDQPAAEEGKDDLRSKLDDLFDD